MAGAFESLLDVSCDCISRAIEEVNQTLDDNPDNQILIQEMVQDPEVSGVIPLLPY